MESEGFDWDHAKNAANARKHDITFERAISVFHDPARIEWICSEDDDDEERYMVVGRVGWRLVSVVYTERGDVVLIDLSTKGKPP